jgi:hypothetical protein
MRFFSNGLKPFNIQIIFKFDLFPRFLIQNPEGVGSGVKNESCSFSSRGSPKNVSRI